MAAPGRPPLTPRVLTYSVVAAGLALTVAVVLLPFARFAYRAPVLHVVLETVEGCIALVVAYLLYGRYLRTGSARALLLTCALVIVAVANLALQALPQALGGDELTAWAPLSVRLLGVTVLAVAAFSPPETRATPTWARAGIGGSTLVVVGTVSAAVLFGDRLPAAVEAVWPGDGVTPVLGGHPLALLAQIVSGVLYAAAAVAFTRQAERESDELQRWLGAGCGLAAVARVNYVLFPSLYSDYVYVGDVLRLGFYLLMLVGAMREVQSYWASQAQAAVLEDRRRLARDLHDGLTQELTYIWSQSQLLAKDPGNMAVVGRLNGAASRAIDEARAAIAALTRTTTGTFVSVLQESVDGLAGRYGARGNVVVEIHEEPSPAQAEAILRIVAEAFRNAVRHGGATALDVRLTGLPLMLSVSDDGGGFALGTAKSVGSGFGLTSMRERAEGLGAVFELRSQIGRGTTGQVIWP